MPALSAARDLQWPVHGPRRPAPFVARQAPREARALHGRIEDFFSRRLGVPATLLPSGRAAIAALLEHLGVGRGDLVFAPRWSSSCVWSVIGRVANPTASLRPLPKAALAVHKWGWRHAAPGLRGPVLIEDSVDSAFEDGRDLFALGGRYEVISLPKILGAYSGGLVLTRDGGFRRKVLAARRRGAALGRRLSEMKHRSFKGGGTALDLEILHALEPANRTLDLNALRHIDACLPLLDRNCATIARRLRRLRPWGAPAPESLRGRLPAVFPMPVRHADAGLRRLLQVRHFDPSLRLDRDRFEPCWVLPLHMGVSEADFERAVARLARPS